MKDPKYVEKLRYYDEPPYKRDIEASSMEKDDGYFQLFSDENRIINPCLEMIDVSNCINNPLCNWDNILQQCYRVHLNKSTTK